MKLPRDIQGIELANSLSKFGYKITRQTGSHLRLTRISEDVHHITIPKHKTLKIGTLNNILNDVAGHLGKTKEEIAKELWEKD
ncbi:MAG: type II toxin-antitoxin system HicA family toxin [Candidatus Saccharicenans sp.]|jgi:predicted RNA binding protein YcfA (HicA-like mRNA interferase family)